MTKKINDLSKSSIIQVGTDENVLSRTMFQYRIGMLYTCSVDRTEIIQYEIDLKERRHQAITDELRF
jgi:hypothetical protein